MTRSNIYGVSAATEMGRSHNWAKSQISNPKLNKQVNILILLEKRPGYEDCHLTFAATLYSDRGGFCCCVRGGAEPLRNGSI
jgi:hypothetical protein